MHTTFIDIVVYGRLGEVGSKHHRHAPEALCILTKEMIDIVEYNTGMSDVRKNSPISTFIISVETNL